MKSIKTGIAAVLLSSIAFMSCTHDDTSTYKPVLPGVNQSSDILLVKKFSTAPNFDGDVDEVWGEARPLINKATVTPAGDREITLNPSSGGDLSLEPTDLMNPYTGEAYNYSLRGGHDGQYLYLLFEWEDDTDSKERESWFFNRDTSKWQQENKYANHKNDKFYEDKFGFMFPIKANGSYPEGFEAGTCTVTCHGGLADPKPGEKVTRHYMKNAGELADFWHWKRDRHALAEAVDDGFVQWEDDFGMASANGRKNDDGISPYANNQTFEDTATGMKGPKYVIPNRENYYWIAQSEIDAGTAKAVTAIALDGTITHEGGTIDPNGDPAYSQGFGNKRIPSVIINPGGQGNDGRSEVQVKAKHTGTGWQIEIRRLLSTGDPKDAEFKIGETLPFGLAIFNNAAIAHGQTNFLTMKIE
ncbi:ethylbenzene dehydrogenase-related protein [Gelidibacter salicanalis]|uniref:Cytochrome c-552/DMSO reductase-like haem-binding domain-containing protein n=1 Tax=Gelidibacter salicanalis TaxID=291193 RepID=A0A934NGZ9_9FLAO|nr:ethylbenzene dehydrogenase-related protein [Gelidibacter salicanalis]MBJ7880201.1 hypothetical protein [Gelidibacter salicanalis]